MNLNDDELLEPETCGHNVQITGSGFYCNSHDQRTNEHVWRGKGQASRGLGYVDNLDTELEVRWRDDRPAATVGDVRRVVAARVPRNK